VVQQLSNLINLSAVAAVDFVCSEAKTLTGMINVGSNERAQYIEVYLQVIVSVRKDNHRRHCPR
jgi:hypothetical protein